MSRLSTLALSAALFVVATPAFAAKDCHSDYKGFVKEMAAISNKISDFDFAEAQRKGLSLYDACNAGDAFEPGSFAKIVRDAQKKAGIAVE